jgi:hypothetical protein
MICPTGIAKYFCKRDWTTQIKLNRLKKSTDLPVGHLIIIVLAYGAVDFILNFRSIALKRRLFASSHADPKACRARRRLASIARGLIHGRAGCQDRNFVAGRPYQ